MRYFLCTQLTVPFSQLFPNAPLHSDFIIKQSNQNTSISGNSYRLANTSARIHNEYNIHSSKLSQCISKFNFIIRNYPAKQPDSVKAAQLLILIFLSNLADHDSSGGAPERRARLSDVFHKDSTDFFVNLQILKEKLIYPRIWILKIVEQRNNKIYLIMVHVETLLLGKL